MATYIEGQTVWVSQEPTIQDVIDLGYELPVNFKIVDQNSQDFKIVSFFLNQEEEIEKRFLGVNLPSYVDDVIEGYYSEGDFYSDEVLENPITGERGKIYLDLPTGESYRWTGSVFLFIGTKKLKVSLSDDIDGTNGYQIVNSELGNLGFYTEHFNYDYTPNGDINVPTISLKKNYLEKPIMTNNYYGLWNDSDKKFITGSIYKNGSNTYISDKLYTQGGVNTKDLSFTLQSSITPTPNTLVPKTDGSGLMWYNNSSVSNELMILPSNSKFILNNNGNTVIGNNSFYSITTGASNTVFGQTAMALSTTGRRNSVYGWWALANSVTGNDNSAFGYTSTSNNLGSGNSAFGYNSLPSTSNNSNAFGTNSGAGNENCTFGNNSGRSNLGGNSNSFVGNNTMQYVNNSSNNVAIGTYAGNQSISNLELVSANNTVYIGYYIKSSSTSVNNEIVIGSQSEGQGSNTATIGNSNTETLHLLKNGAGIILKSPDGTKKVKISIDNTGNLITTIV